MKCIASVLVSAILASSQVMDLPGRPPLLAIESADAASECGVLEVQCHHANATRSQLLHFYNLYTLLSMRQCTAANSVKVHPILLPLV